MRNALSIVALLLVAAAGLPAAAQEPEVSVTVADSEGRVVEQVYEGQSVQYVITLKNADEVSQPELKGFDDFDVVLAGKRSLGISQIIINGRKVEDTRGGVQFVYRLTPRKVGLLKIPPVTVEADGRVLEGPEKTLRVRAADEQDVVFMKIVSDRPSVYPMQPLTVTLTVQVKALPGRAAEQSPLGVQSDPPLLNIPWALDEDLPDGLEPSVGWQSWLGPMQNQANQGFSINNLGRGSLYSLFGSRPLTFEPRFRRITRPDAAGREADYWEYEFPRVFVARKVGTLKFGPVALEGFFGVRVNAESKLVGESVYAVAKQIAVDVKDVPTEGRPDTYTGAIGRFSLSGRLEPDRVKVGDPMTLTLTLTGEGTLGSTFAPDLEQVPEIASRFKLYEATEETSGNASQFTYALRPLEEGIDRFPPVPLAYFDIESERFVTLKTDPIPITVAAADLLSSDQVVAAPGAASSGRRELEARGEGIFANVTDVGLLRNEQVRPARWVAALGGLVGLYLVVAVVGVRMQRLTGDKALVRRRAAASAARRRLREAKAALQSGDVRGGNGLLEAALIHLTADAADAPASGLTPKDVCGHLRALGVEHELVHRAGRFLDTCDAGRYGASTPGDENMIHEAEALVGETIHSLSKKKRLR